MSESRQHWLDRNRPPRVQITYDVETLGSSAKQEIPFVVGVMGDFAGPGNQAAGKALAQRGFVEIDRDNFEKVMAAQQASLDLGKKRLGKVAPAADGSSGYTVSTTETDAQKVPVKLDIRSLKDFGPLRILEQLGQTDAGKPIADMMQVRQYLSELLVKIQGNVWSPERAPADASAALRAAAPQIAKVQETLARFKSPTVAPGEFDTSAFVPADKTAFDTAVGEVTTAAGTGNTALTKVLGDLPAAPAATDMTAISTAAASLGTLRDKVDAAITALNKAVGGITDATKKGLAGAPAAAAAAEATRLGELTGRARAATDLAVKYLPPAAPAAPTTPETPA